jgi:tripartite-type tricarboxylate transporter receptor subunit TctC
MGAVCRLSESFALACLVLALLLALACPAQAAYPAKPIRLLIAASAGSGSDTIGRIIALGLTKTLGQQVFVENRAGAANNIGAEIAARAPADGHTLFLIHMGTAANVTLYDNLTYDLVRDFEPVTQYATAPMVMTVHPSLPAKTIPDFINLAKAKPGAINYSSGGIGSPTFIATELFTAQTGVNLMHVAYRSGAEALTAILSGEVSVYFAPFATALPHIRQGRVRAVAVTSAKRVPLMHEFPTIAESGYSGYDAGNWYGIVVPAKTPKDTIKVIRNAAVTSLHNPEVGKRLSDLGYVPVGDEPDEFAAHIKSQIVKLGKVLKAARPSGK